MTESIVSQVVEQLQEMPENLQRRVLDYIQRLKVTSEQGIPGRQLLQFAGSISNEDLIRMQEAIDRECENIDTNEW